jgi:hypothetical protein
MNIVRSRPLGQFDPSTGIVGEIMLGPQEPAPVDTGILSPYQTYGSAYPDITAAPSTPVAHPSGAPLATFGPYGTTDPTAVSVPSPAPRVNVPLTTSSFFSSTLGGIPTIAWIGIAVLGAVALGRRKR